MSKQTLFIRIESDKEISRSELVGALIVGLSTNWEIEVVDKKELKLTKKTAKSIEKT